MPYSRKSAWAQGSTLGVSLGDSQGVNGGVGQRLGVRYESFPRKLRSFSAWEGQKSRTLVPFYGLPYPQPLTYAALGPPNPLGAASPEGTPKVEPCALALFREKVLN